MDLDRVTRRFSDSFRSAHMALAAGFRGRDNHEQRRRQASDVLNRLMFACFTAGAARCDTPRDVRKALSAISVRNGQPGGASRARNGHATSLSDGACRHLLDFARQWEWRLADGPPAHAGEVTPEVLGLILEQHVNQRQTGSYYTRPDVTRYIARATIIPTLLDAVAARHSGPDSFESTWRRQLRQHPLRYIHPAMRKGALRDDGAPIRLPRHVALGINRIDQRAAWNQPADAPFGLPAETWRDVVERRTRCLEILESVRAGEIRSIDDLITWNLDLAQLLGDTIAAIDDARPVGMLHEVLTAFRVLDPTCGSGAFLVAALEVLEPIHEACLARLEPASNARSRRAARSTGLPTRDDASGPVANRRRAAIRRAIITHNLYGIDLLPETVEMCRLRLRLKIAAATARGNGRRHTADAPHGFNNIQVGDALAMDGVDQTRDRSRSSRANGASPVHSTAFSRVPSRAGFDVVIGNPPYIETGRGTAATASVPFKVAGTGNLFALCTERSLDLLRPGGRLGLVVPMSAVSTPRMRPLMELMCERLAPLWLSHYACRPGKLFAGADMNVTIVLGRTRAVVARSPAVVARSPDRATAPTAGLPDHVNRSGDLRSDARRGQETRAERGTRAERPSHGKVFTTGYRRWSKPFRPFLFDTLRYTPTESLSERGTIPKPQTGLERALLHKLLGFAADGRLRGHGPSAETLYCHSGGRYFRKCLRRRLSNEYKPLTVPAGWGDAVVCLLSSSLFYWMWIALSDCYHVTDRDLGFLPLVESLAADRKLARLARRLLDDLWANSETRDRRRADGSTQREVNFDVSRSRPLLDEIDRVLARHFGLSDAELDFILNFEARYRMAQS